MKPASTISARRIRQTFQIVACLVSLFPTAYPANAADANRLTYLDEFNPFQAGLQFPKLTTPQWVGEPGVEAVVILSIDDMSSAPKYEQVLRPILDRLKKIDGHAPLSIFCTSPNPDDPQLQSWLKEGLSFEVHTLSHPCPCLGKDNFAAATNTFFGCVDLLNHIPGNHPVAYRMPCCDSINSPSPRFYSEIFNRANAAGQFLGIDTSVMNIVTTNDPGLPREMVIDADGREKFRKYVPFPSFTANIDNYPYPYQIGSTIWEFPCVVPSDWEGQNCFKASNQLAVANDWKTMLDITVLKQGTFTLVFHPHGWIKPEQIVELIDYAVSKYGGKVKFLNFREAQERLNRNLLAGQPLRAPDGSDNGARMLDVNGDGYMDVVIGNEQLKRTRVWNPGKGQWEETDFPAQLAGGGARFGIVQSSGMASVIRCDERSAGAWDFDGTKWASNASLLKGLESNGKPILTAHNGVDGGIRLRDVDNDGRCELIVANEDQNAVLQWSGDGWKELPYGLPDDVRITDASGRDLGARFVDVNEDGFPDLIFSNEKEYSLHLFLKDDYFGMPPGWSHKIRSGKRGDHGEIPMIVRGGDFPNNGAWFRNGTLWVQNENTAGKPDLVERCSFDEMLALEAPSAKSPQESLACIHVRPGFKVELVASEPLIKSPVSFEWGADGKLWVLEMGDYPLGVDGKGGAGGGVKFLEDTNADGIYDKATVFMEGLKIPTGLYPWRKGVLVLAAPELFYAEDTDGDGKADVKKVMFEGFRPGNPQHRANGFDYALDNWLYGANGDSGGVVTSLPTGRKVDIRGRDFRFRPDTGEFESESGQTQYGRHRDDWDDWFGTNNPNWLWHYLFAEHYIARNPHLPVRDNKQFPADYDDDKRVYAISEPLERFNDPNGLEHVTSGCSVMPYRDELFGPDFATSVFTCEPVHNVVHREVLEADGVSFRSHRAAGEERSEFLASTDNWFRPVMVKTGADGALYVADIYRLVIEHPEWISTDRQKRIDMRAGADKGRIYRVAPDGAKLRAIPNLQAMNLAQLVAAMDSPNGWQRDTAQRLLVTARDAAAIEPLRKLVQESARPKTRAQALSALEGLGGTTPDVLAATLGDAHPRVREIAARASEGLLKSAGTGAIPEVFANALLKLADDPEIRVRHQLAFSLGEWDDARAAKALAHIALRDWQDAQMRIAVMSAATKRTAEILATVLAAKDPTPSLVEQLMGLVTAMGDEKEYARVLKIIGESKNAHHEPWQYGALAGFLEVLERKGTTLAQIRKNGSDEIRQAAGELDSLFDDARRVVDNPASAQGGEFLENACRLLGHDPQHEDEDVTRLCRMLEPQSPGELQQAALSGLKGLKSAVVATQLLRGWKGLGPAMKTEVVNVLYSRPAWLEAALVAIEKGELPAAQIGTPAQQRLLNHPDARIRERAVKLFFANADRQRIVKEYSVVETLKGDATKGRALFVQNCAPCHRLNNEGNQVGPELGMMSDKPARDIVLAILDPNQAVEARYLGYTAILKNGREVSGVISTETPTSVTLKNAGGMEETLLRGDFSELKGGSLSLMPEGFENALKPQDMADLIRYIKAGK